jgi:hypothetical protein
MNSPIPISEDILIKSTILDIAALRTINLELANLAIKNDINSPACRAIRQVISGNEQILTENVTLKHRLASIRKNICVRQESRNGK